jgi:hypothetical protein
MHESVYVFQLRPSGTRYDNPEVLTAGHEPGLGCYEEVPQAQAWLLGIGSLRSSSTAPYFAVAKTWYETGKDIASACTGPHQRKVRETTGEIRFRVVAGKVTVVAPVQFVNRPDSVP